jgi:hypothetical protein
LQSSPRQPEKEDAGMGEALVEDQLPEVAIGSKRPAICVLLG